MSKNFMINRRTALGGAAAAGRRLRPAGRPRAGQQADRRRHLGRRLLAPAHQEHRHAAARPRGLGRACTTEATIPTARGQDDGRAVGCGAARRTCRASRPTTCTRCNQQGLTEQLDYSKMPNAKNLIPAMKYPYGIGHIYSGKVVLYNPDMMDSAHRLRGHARSQAWQQARHHRHPAPVQHGGRGPRIGRLGQQLRARQGAADRLPQGGRAHLSVKRGVRPGAQDRRDRLRHHVEGPRSAVAECRHQGADRGAQGRRADVRLGLRGPEERAQQGRRLCLSRTP